MKRGIFVLGALFALLPSLAFAQALSCSSNGYTVVFVNGIFNTETEALANVKALQAKLKTSFNSQPLTVYLGYNPTHLAGAGDLIESYFPSWDSYDLDTILLQIYPEVTTRKLLVVGHSQGSVYANKIYEYLVGNGEPSNAVGVYAVGTPDSYVAGGGKYLTYTLDPVINKVRLLKRFNPLPANIDIVDLSPDVPVEGHSFTSEYLAGAPDRIVAEIQGELASLQASGQGNGQGCFTPPVIGAAYKVEQATLAVADPVASAARGGIEAGYQGAKTAAVAATTLAQAGYTSLASAVSSIKNVFSVHLGTKEQDEATFQVVKALYGSSLDDKDIKELINKDQGSAVVLATASVPTPKKVEQKTAGLVLGAQTEDTSVKTSSSVDAAPKPKKKGVQSSGGVLLPMVVETAPATSTDDVPEATTTPDIVEEEVATTTATSTEPVGISFPPDSFIVASQPDDSVLCVPDWRDCYASAGSTNIDLGQGAELGGGSIFSVTIAKEEASPYTHYPWIVSIYCYVDAAHTQPCPDWIEQNIWNSFQSRLITEAATTTADNKYWTAYFTNPNNEKNSDGTHPVTFRPEYYYVLSINDNGWNIGAYGSATEPYWVLRGMPQQTPAEPQTYVMASQPDESYLCAPVWRDCYTGGTHQTIIDLGKGSTLGGGSIKDITVAKEEISPYLLHFWNIFIVCYTDDTYTTVCPDWVQANAWNGYQTFKIDELATSTTADNKYWTADFTDPTHEVNFDNSTPVTFNPDYYYRLTIDDSGWGIGAYGSPDGKVYWVLRGEH